MYKYIFTAAAEKDLEEAYLWYEEQNDGLGVQLLDDVELACQYIAQSPQSYPVFSKDRRRILLKALGSKFKSYMLIYRIREKEKEIIIVAFAHASRDPRVWKGR